MQKFKPKLAFNALIILVSSAAFIYNLPAVLQMLGIGREVTADYLIPEGNVIVAFDNRVIAYEAVPNGTIRRTFLNIDSTGLEYYALGLIKSDDNGISEDTYWIDGDGRAREGNSIKHYPKKAGDGDGISLSSGFIDVGNKIKFYDKSYDCLSIMRTQYSDTSTYCKGIGYFGTWTDKGESIGLTEPYGVNTGISDDNLEANIVNGIATMLYYREWDSLKAIGDRNKVLEMYQKLVARLTATGSRPLPAAIVSVCLMARAPSAIEVNFEKNLPFCWEQIAKYAKEEKNWADSLRENNPKLMNDETYKAAVGFIKADSLHYLSKKSEKETPSPTALKASTTTKGAMAVTLEGKDYIYKLIKLESKEASQAITLMMTQPGKSTQHPLNDNPLFHDAKIVQEQDGKTSLVVGGEKLLTTFQLDEKHPYDMLSLSSLDSQPEILLIDTFAGGNSCESQKQMLLVKSSSGYSTTLTFGRCQVSWIDNKEKSTTYFVYEADEYNPLEVMALTHTIRQ